MSKRAGAQGSGAGVNALLGSALACAARGWPVLPCKGKVPLTPHGLHDASTDGATIRAWWAKWPDANVGVRTGRESGLVVIDADGEEGHVTLRAHEREHGKLPRTLSTKTPHDGSHFVFQHPGDREIRNSAGRLGEGLDVRADGGYVVVPPSRGDNGRNYELDENAPPAPLPQWLLALLVLGPKGDDSGRAEPIHGIVLEGTRRGVMLSIAGSLRHRGLDSAEILPALQEVNRRRCRTRDGSEPAPLPDRELRDVAIAADG
jgi:Bifunctional DNA primase/polymerase, N-terminal